MSKNGNGLSRKHRVFVDNYFLHNLNATDAYGATYPKASRETARRNGSVLLSNTDISEEIERRLKEKAMSADEILARLGEQARADYSQYIKDNGTVDLPKLIEDGKAHLIQGIKDTKWGKDVKFPDIQSALIHLGKAHALFTDRIDHSVEVDGKLVILPKQDG